MPPRDLRTVLFTDIVGSTEQAARLGDRAWGALLARHHALVRAALRQHGGREVDTAGDGFFATFGRPTDALACARQVVAGVDDLGLAVRVGLHAGEVESRAGKAEGITVHVAARLMAAATSDEVLVSGTVHDLVAGAGWTFHDRGSLPLKGLSEPIHGYALDLAAPAPTAAAGPVGLAARLRDHPAGRWALGTGLVVILLVAVLLAVTLAGDVAGQPPTPSPTAVAGASPGSSVASVSPSANASPTAALIHGDDPLEGPVAPGRYTLADLPGRPTVTINDDGWEVFGLAPYVLALDRRTSPTERLAIFSLGNLPIDACGLLTPFEEVGANPEQQFVAWARANKGLMLSTGIPRQLGELAATEFEVTVVDRYACQYTSPVSIALTGLEGGGPALRVGASQRLEVSSRGGGLIIVLIDAPTAAAFDAFEPLVEQVLSSWDFTT